jgi:hypothetical protein
MWGAVAEWLASDGFRVDGMVAAVEALLGEACKLDPLLIDQTTQGCCRRSPMPTVGHVLDAPKV